jgi:hypothetical protein
MLRVQIPSLTPLLRLCSSDGISERKFPKLEVARSSRAKAILFWIFISSKFTKVRSFNWQNAGLQNRSFQFKSERACQIFLNERGKIRLPISHLTFFLSRKISLIGKAVVLKTIALLSLAGSSPASSANSILYFGLPILDYLNFKLLVILLLQIQNTKSQIQNHYGGVAQRI